MTNFRDQLVLGADFLIDMNSDAISDLVFDDSTLSVADIEHLNELKRKRIAYLEFRQRFVAGESYNLEVLAEVVQCLLERDQ